MLVLIVAIVVGCLVGLLLGGRPSALAQQRFRLWPLLFVGLALQLGLGSFGNFAFTALLLSFACVLVFGFANLLVRGMTIVVIGVALNATAVAVNEGMPVRRSALYEANAVADDWTPRRDLGHKHHLERPDDDLVFLADIIPVAPLQEVVSFGDLIMAVGMADVMVHLLRPPRRRRARRIRLDVIDLDAALQPYVLGADRVVDLTGEDERVPTAVT